MRLWKADLTVTPAYILDHPVYCAVHGSSVVGFYALSDTGTARELEHMWVLPTRMGSGVGRALFAHLLGQLQAMRAASLRIASDPNAEGFYRRMGARRVGRVPSRPAGRYLPVLAFRLRLSGRRNR
jgi:GNAT superfamily N-acetyltransferase